MPPAAAAVAVPVALGIAGMVNQNVQNKAANANNDNQKADALQAWKKAQANFQSMYPNGGVPNVQTGAAPTAPAPAGSAPTRVPTASTAQTSGTPAVPQAAGTDVVSQIMKALVPQQQAQAKPPVVPQQAQAPRVPIGTVIPMRTGA